MAITNIESGQPLALEDEVIIADAEEPEPIVETPVVIDSVVCGDNVCDRTEKCSCSRDCPVETGYYYIPLLFSLIIFLFILFGIAKDKKYYGINYLESLIILQSHWIGNINS